jgi:hypothetical protein
MEAVQHSLEVQQVRLPAAATPPIPSISTNTTAIVAPVATPSPPSTEPASKRRKYNLDELVNCSKDYQKEASKRDISKSELLDLLDAAVAEVLEQKLQGKVLNDPLKTWAYKAGKVVHCLQTCHQNDKESFLQANKTFTVSRFRCLHGAKHSFCFDGSKH